MSRSIVSTARALITRSLCLVALGLLASRGSAGAQALSVQGVVTDSASGRPLPDALVRVVGSDLSAHTNLRGQFTVTGLTAPTVSLVISRIGYRPRTLAATAGATDLAIALSVSVLRLDELLVTGQAGDTRKRALGNVIGEVDMAAVQELAPSKSVQEALSVGVPGLQVQRASGQLGTGGVTRIRGVSSLSLSSEPLIFIDGVRADNTAGSNSVGFNGGGDHPSRINDIDPNDIESIQVLKGPSAATLYGTEASN
ncbi:MAG TPA: TonB-dependent receptor plug domain-containing protein, partial [Gemmatimonadales bacterium]|nr:TonB-dependent receptor plug domain-containing protein [Gemmatimonadales bacterium]